jgi:hypothetical protein
MKITRSGGFAFTGKAERTVVTNSGGGNHEINHALHVTLAGKFVTSTRATISITIAYDRCGT